MAIKHDCYFGEGGMNEQSSWSNNRAMLQPTKIMFLYKES